jgi:hypothetical protein
MSVHEFDERLAFSHGQSDQWWWEVVYRRAFPDMVSMVDLRADGWHQRAGRDRAVVLSSGRAVYVDEKVRNKSYRDIALEIHLPQIWQAPVQAGRRSQARVGPQAAGL